MAELLTVLEVVVVVVEEVVEVVVEEVEEVVEVVEKGCARLMEIAPLRILCAPSGDSASVPPTNQEEQTVGAKVEEEEEAEEPVVQTPIVLKRTRFAQNGVSASALNISPETPNATLEHHRATFVNIFLKFSALFSKLFLHA